MTLIVGTLLDSGNVPLTGVLEITLSERMDAPPNNLLTTKLAAYTVNSGVVNLELEASQQQLTSYHFQFYTGDGVERSYYLDFHAIVPDVPLVNFNSLIPSGITTDLLDTSISRLADIITSNPVYAARVKAGFNGRGAFDNAATYYYNDIVSSDGASYAFINKLPNSSKPLTDDNYWQLLASRGLTGTGTGGNDTAYGVGWNGQIDAPTRNAIYELVESLLVKQSTINGLAPLNSPTLTGTPTAPTQNTLNNTARLATTAFVYKVVESIISAPGNAPIAPTVPSNTNSAALASTKFVWDALAPIVDVAAPSIPRVVTASLGDSSQKIANTAFVSDAVNGAINTANANANASVSGAIALLTKVNTASSSVVSFDGGTKFNFGTWQSPSQTFNANTEYAFSIPCLSYSNILTMQLCLRAGLASTGQAVLRGTSEAGNTSFALIIKHNVTFTGQMFVSWFLALN